MVSLKKEVIIRGIKIFDIGYITVVYFALGYTLAFIVDKWIAKLSVEIFGAPSEGRITIISPEPPVPPMVLSGKNSDKSKWRLVGEILVQVIVIGILTYVMRNLVELIPFPLDGIMGYDHMKVKELKSGALFTVFVVMFSYNMQDKLLQLRSLLTRRGDK